LISKIKFSSAKVEEDIRAIGNFIEKHKVPIGSSLVYIHEFEETSPRIDKIYSLTSFKDYNFERFQFDYFLIDHSIGKFSSNWKLVKRPEIIEGIPIDKSPSILSDDIMARYIGARVGDYVSYNVVSDSEIGPFEEYQIAVISEGLGGEEDTF
jgi:hypothetical protein